MLSWGTNPKSFSLKQRSSDSLYSLKDPDGDGIDEGDTTAPVLSSPSASASGTTSGSLSASTDEGNGTLYWVVDQSATPPSQAQVKAGQDSGGAAADASGSQAVSSTGVQNVSATGLSTSTTYYAHFMHEDGSSNQSSVATSASFTTNAAVVVASGWILGASVDITGTQLSIRFDRTVVDGGAGFNDMSANFSDGAATLTYNSGGGTDTLVYDISRTVSAYEDLLFSYTQPGNGIEALTDGEDLPSFTNRVALNNSIQTAVGTTYYVSDPSFDATASDGNTGTSINTAWATIAAANDQTYSPGDVVVFSGNFDTSGDLSSTRTRGGAASWSNPAYAIRDNGTAAARIVWKAHPVNGASTDSGITSTAQSGPSDGTQAPIGIDGSYTILEGFTIQNCYAKGVMTKISSAPSNVTVRRMYINGVFHNSTGDNSVGMRLENISSFTLSDNKITNVHNQGDTHNAAAFEFYDTTDGVIEHNEVWALPNACYDKENGLRNIWRYNRIYDTTRGWRLENGVVNDEIYGNVVYRVDFPFDITPHPSGAVSGLTLYNNSMYDYVSEFAVKFGDNCDTAQQYNNIYHRGATGPSVADYATYAPDNSDLTLSDYNLFWDDFVALYHRYETGQVTRDTLALACSNESRECNSVESDPLYTDPANGDLTLQSGSPAEGAGSSDGTTGGSAVDMGAYRFGMPIGQRQAA